MNIWLLALHLAQLVHKLFGLSDESRLFLAMSKPGLESSIEYKQIQVSECLQFDASEVLNAIAITPEHENLNILVHPTPVYISDAEEVVRKLYELSPAEKCINYTVYLEDPRKLKRQQRLAALNPKPVQHLCKDECKPQLGDYSVVAVGGTFDHLHIGHKVLLSMAAYSASFKVIVGITVDSLLVNKQYAEYLETFEQREATVKAFIRSLKPDMLIETYPLDNMFGPTTGIKKIDALVVSKETREGANFVNDARKKLNWPALDIIEIGLIDAKVGKLSSTQIRESIATATATANANSTGNSTGNSTVETTPTAN